MSSYFGCVNGVCVCDKGENYLSQTLKVIILFLLKRLFPTRFERATEGGGRAQIPGCVNKYKMRI